MHHVPHQTNQVCNYFASDPALTPPWLMQGGQGCTFIHGGISKSSGTDGKLPEAPGLKRQLSPGSKIHKTSSTVQQCTLAQIIADFN